jgi:hypothetical protein
MLTIRRLYVYIITLVSLEVVLWGLIGLLRTTFATGAFLPGAELLAQAMALILVGVPIFALHWRWAQQFAAKDEDERGSPVRALFFYALLGATLLPAVQNALALLSRGLISLARDSVSYAIVGGSQTLIDNLLAMLINGLAAAYFFVQLRADWAAFRQAPLSDAAQVFGEVRRIYRYIWLFYALLMTVFGLQQILHYLLGLFSPSVDGIGSALHPLMNGLALALVGAPLWAYTWNLCQFALEDPGEETSLLRLSSLYLLVFGSVLAVLGSAGVALDVLLRFLFRDIFAGELTQSLRGPLSVGIPLAIVWAYYQRWLRAGFNAQTDSLRRSGFWALYRYSLLLVGFVASLIGLMMLLTFFVEFLFSPQQVWNNDSDTLAASLATLAAGIPLWLWFWRQAQGQALARSPEGTEARRSTIRRMYLYLVILAMVLGSMISAIAMFYTVFVALLGEMPAQFWQETLNGLQRVLVFAVFLAYHWQTLRADGGEAAQALSEKLEQYPVLVFYTQTEGFAPALLQAARRAAPGLPIAFQPMEQGIPPEADLAQAVVVSSGLALNPPEALRVWLGSFNGAKVIIPLPVEGWHGGWSLHSAWAAQTAQTLRHLALGEQPRPPAGNSAWQTAAYVLAALFLLQVLGFFLLFGISLVAGF